mgnify:CR=1 FL=1
MAGSSLLCYVAQNWLCTLTASAQVDVLALPSPRYGDSAEQIVQIKSGRHLQVFKEIPINGMDLHFDVFTDSHFGHLSPLFTFPANITTCPQSEQINLAIFSPYIHAELRA